MKTTLIKLQDKFILVSDEEIKQGDFTIYKSEEIVQYDVKLNTDNLKKIIAGIPELPSIDFSLLSEEDCKTIGWIDWIKYAINEEENEIGYNKEYHSSSWFNGVKFGFEKAQSLNDKMFSLEDMKNMVLSFAEDCEKNEDLIWYDGEENGIKQYKNAKIWFNDYIQLLQQSKVWNIEIEMEGYIPIKGYVNTIQPKIINNSIKVIKILKS